MYSDQYWRDSAERAHRDRVEAGMDQLSAIQAQALLIQSAQAELIVAKERLEEHRRQSRELLFGFTK